MRRPLLSNLDLELDVDKGSCKSFDQGSKFSSQSNSNSVTKKSLLGLCIVLSLICICLMFYCIHLIRWTNEHVKVKSMCFSYIYCCFACLHQYFKQLYSIVCSSNIAFKVI